MHNRGTVQKIIAVVMLLMALGTALRPHATIGVIGYMTTRMGISEHGFALLLLAGAALMILAAPRVPVWWLPTVERIALAPLWLYTGAAVLYVAFADVNLSPAFIYPAFCLLLHLAGVGNGRID